MSLSTQLLSSLIGLREQTTLERPAVGDELGDAAHGPSSVEIGEDVDEVVACGKAQQSTGLHESVGSSESFGGFGGACEEIVFAADAGLAQDALGVSVVDLEAAIRKAAPRRPPPFPADRPLLRGRRAAFRCSDCPPERPHGAHVRM